MTGRKTPKRGNAVCARAPLGACELPSAKYAAEFATPPAPSPMCGTTTYAPHAMTMPQELVYKLPVRYNQGLAIGRTEEERRKPPAAHGSYASA